MNGARLKPSRYVENLWHDLRHGLRMFAKNPGFTAIAVISIAFGTGGNVAMFSAVDALLLRPLPVERPGDLVTVGSRITRGISTINVASYPDYVDILSRTQSFDGLLASTQRIVGLGLQPGAPPQMRMVTLVSGNFFGVLGVEPEIGRAFLPEEDRVPGRDAVVVLSYGLWQGHFGGDPGVLGRTLRIGGIDFLVVGVAPERFTGIDPRFIREGAYVPLAMWPRLVSDTAVDPLRARDLRLLTLKGRLKAGVTLGRARAELAAIGRDLEREHPDTNRDTAVTAETEFAYRFERNPLDAWLLVILSMLSLTVLSVACANVAGLLASRAPVRAREISLRLAVGAGRARIVGQLVTESVAIAVAGGLGGALVGLVGIRLLRQIQFPTDVIAVPEMRLDERAFAFSLLLAIGSAFLFGIGPAIQTAKVDLAGMLKSSDAHAGGRRRLAARNVLVALQVALSLVVLTMAVFAFQVFRRELLDGPGFRTARMVKVNIDPMQARYTTRQAIRFFERVVDDVRHLPGVESASVASVMPLFGLDQTTVVPEGFRLPDGQKGLKTNVNAIGETYFDTMGIPLVAGRGLRDTDTSATPQVAVVNDTFARRFWPEGAAIGRRFRLVDERGPWVEIVGVVGTTTYLYPGEQPQDMVYFPYRQEPPRASMILLVSTSGDSAAMLAPVRDVVRRQDADVPFFDLQTMEVFYAARVTSIGTVISRLIDGIGLMGLALTMVGLYGLVSYSVGRRTREIGIRIAIGATSGRVMRMILRQGMAPAWVGLGVGVVLSAATMRVLPMMVPFTHRFEPRTFLLVVPLLFAVTLVAAYLPARRAARIAPTEALRCE